MFMNPTEARDRYKTAILVQDFTKQIGIEFH